MAWNLEENPLATAKGVEELLAIRLQLRLVVHVDEKLLAIQDIGDSVLLRIVCNKPVNEAQRHLRCALENLDQLLLVRVLTIETLERTYDKLLLAMNLALACLGVRINLYDLHSVWLLVRFLGLFFAVS